MTTFQFSIEGFGTLEIDPNDEEYEYMFKDSHGGFRSRLKQKD